MATVRRRIYAVIDVILRVPPVFLVDSLLRNSITFDFSQIQMENSQISMNATKTGDENLEWYDVNVQELSKVMFTLAGILSSVTVFMLRTNKLITFYLWVISVLSILLSYNLNEKQVETLQSNDNNLFQTISSTTYAFSSQIAISLLFFISNAGTGIIKSPMTICFAFVLPSFAFFVPILPMAILRVFPLISASYALLHMSAGLLNSGRLIITFILKSLKRILYIYRVHGLHELIEENWHRVGIPQVLRVFWLTRITEQALVLVVESSGSFAGIFKIPTNDIVQIIKTLMTKGCDTYITVAGLTCVLSSICQGLGHAFHLFLMTEDREEERNMGTVSAVLFMILALQTGLTSLPPDKRFTRLYRNLCLLSTAVLHFIHSMVNPLLMSLSASHNISLNRHIRALSVCAFLIVFPYLVLTYLWQTHTISTWLLAISAFSIEVIIKVLTSLMVYALFIIDARRETFWEKLDDYVYYIRSTGNTIEFLFGIFLFFNGAWILIFESGGTIRALMMVIHAYCNIWLQAKAGWQIFMKRRMAVYKISSLVEASSEKLRDHDDLCSICFQELVTNARITACNHIFHSVCLRKWLYVQDNCPLCHQKIYSSDNQTEQTTVDNGVENNEDNQNLNQVNGFMRPHQD